MKIIFFGTPEYVVPILDTLNKTFTVKPGKSPIVAVVTQKPRPMGRKQIFTYSSVDFWAHKHNVPIFFESRDLITKGIQADLGVLAAYGAIIPKEVINLFPYGILNVHPSLLPKYRGASPVQAAIAAGESETGVTIMKLDEKLDHGEIVSQFKEEVLPDDTAGTLRERLFNRGAEVLVALIEPYLVGKIKPRKQDESETTFTRQIKKEDGFIPPEYLEATFKGGWKIPFIKGYSLSPTPYTLDCFIRAMSPWPGAWTLLRLSATEGQARRLKIIKAHLDNGKLVLDQVQLEGKNPVSWKEFKRGYPNAELR